MSRGTGVNRDDARRAAHTAVSAALAPLDDDRLAALVRTAAPLGSGIGGRSVLLEVGGTRVFVKRVPLTARELRPEHVRSTANLFELPVFCQYGVGGIGHAGPGVWRELAAQEAASDWVLSGEHSGFPLLYHWRVLPEAAPPLPEELADIGRAVDYWGGGPGMRERIEGLRDSPASLVLFLEHVPQNLHEWLDGQMAAGAEAVDRACAFVERELEATVAFMNGRGLLHMDAHFGNILTDGRRLYFTDFGLALSSRFALSPAEADFFDRHRTYDRAYALSYLVNWLVLGLYGHRRDAREALIRAWAEGEPPPAGPPGATALLSRLAPLAATVTDFVGRFEKESRDVPYPAGAVGRLLASYDASRDGTQA
ncbi:protein kinase family protein [Streptomyces sp. NPDC004111]|uniref:protein kinase family protein n=1 Tax=Streptomyces sp. NPDC004111 TaxID=3364690 RepID=UPI0036894B7F